MLEVIAPAKLNLFLHILGKRADGYHLLESLVAFTEFGDVLRFAEADEISLVLDGPFSAAAGRDNNLVLKAAELLAHEAGIKRGATIHLTKCVPVGAGLGGGSADAAATLKALSTLWNITVAAEDLQRLAVQLGADVPMCLASRPAIARGIGDALHFTAPLPNWGVVLVHPGVALLTKDVYRAYGVLSSTPAPRWPEDEMTRAALLTFLREARNDLEGAALEICPVVGEVLQALHAMEDAPLLVRMSGSGACCFALYETPEQARIAAKALRVTHGDWWITSTRLLSHFVGA